MLFCLSGNSGGCRFLGHFGLGLRGGKALRKAVLADVLAVFVHADGQAMEMDMDKMMMNADTMALRTGADWMLRNIGSFSKRATKPKIVVTPVEIRQSMRQTP